MKKGYIIKQVAGTFIFYLVIFISAGKFDYWQGLVYFSIGILMTVLGYTVLKPDAELFAERGKPGEGAKKWDKTILLLSFLATIVMFTLAGLDSGRFHWSPDFHPGLIITGIVFTAAGQFLFLLAQKQNKFFSSTVRIQSDRNHTVCDTGLYKFVRHPAYMGSIIQALGFPLLFESLWSIIPVALLILLFIVRTSLEDETLLKELSGYSDYSNKTRYRIIPFIW